MIFKMAQRPAKWWRKTHRPSDTSRFKGFLDWTQIVANTFASLSVIVAAATYTAKVFIAHETGVDKSFEGRWTNFPEGCVGCQYSELPAFSLHLDVRNSGYTGYADTSNYVSKTNARSAFTEALGVTDHVKFWQVQLCCVSLQADRFLNDINIEIYDYIGGDATVLGHATLKPVGPNYMWVLTDINPIYARFFPKRAWITHFEGGTEGSGKESNDVGYSAQMARRMSMIRDLFMTPDGETKSSASVE